MNMSQELKTEWLPKLQVRYARRGREGKSRLLDELCEDYGYERKYAIKLVGGRRPVPGGRPRPGQKPEVGSQEAFRIKISRFREDSPWRLHRRFPIGVRRRVFA